MLTLVSVYGTGHSGKDSITFAMEILKELVLLHFTSLTKMSGVSS